MKKILKPQELKDYVIEKEDYSITDKDIERLNYVLAHMFQSVWKNNPNAKQVLLKEHGVDGYLFMSNEDICVVVRGMLNWSFDKTYACIDELLSIMKDAGYIFVDRQHKGLAIKILSKETNE